MPPLLTEGSAVAYFLLQKCASTTTLRKARQLHALILTSSLTPSDSPFLNNNILSMYTRCGSLTDSQLLFDKMPQRNVVSYNALISACSRSLSYAHLAFRLFSRLGREGLMPNGSTFTSLLQASARTENRVLGSLLHGQCIKFGALDNVRVLTSLIGMYSSCGDIHWAKEVFIDMDNKDVMAWNSMIFGCSKNREVLAGLRLFYNMLRSGISPTQFTYSMLLNTCSKLADYFNGRLAHAQVILSGIYLDLPLQNALLGMYCSCGKTCIAFNVFRKIEHPDLVSWNSMIGGFSENGHGEKAMDLFVQLLQVCPPRPDEYTFAAIMPGIAAFPSQDYGEPLHGQILKAGFQSSVYVGSTLISMYFSNNETESAQKVFNSIFPKDVVLWTDMIVWHSRIGDGESALKFFNEMLKEGHTLDSFALSGALSACADLATLMPGEMMHAQVLKIGIQADMSVLGSLVDMYAKNGDLHAAEYIFSHLPKRDLKSWNSMLGGYGHHGKAKEVFQIFYQMLKDGIKPDHVTFISMLAACSHCGLVKKGRFFWNYMKENGVRPGPKHYSCMISLLSRAGLLEEAEEMILESPFVDEYLETWRILLSSCIMQGNLEVGNRAAHRILSLDEEDSAANILLTKLYAAAGRWDDVAETRRKIRQLITEKETGLSWIEIKNNIQLFCSGDQSHPQNDEIRGELHKLLGNMMLKETRDIWDTDDIDRVLRPESTTTWFKGINSG